MKAFSVLCLCAFALACAIAQDLPDLPAGKCEPGKSYKQDCNTCNCDSDGNARCTLKACPPAPRSRRSPVPEDLPELPAGKCEPGKAYKQDCNTCNCGTDGNPRCTLKACLPAPRSRRSPVPEDLPELPAGKCEPGKAYKQDCNTCNCGTDGNPRCTLKACPPAPRSRRSPLSEDGLAALAADKCEPGKTYKQDCNTCTCGTDGNPRCTLKLCPERPKRSPVPEDLPELPAGGKCEPGKSYKQDCNTCRCSPTGVPACTYILCAPRTRRSPESPPLKPAPADGSCVPGQQYHVDCNSCICSPQGKLAACTQRACISKRSAEPQECSTGDSKKDDCNDCHCANGRWACTKKFCVRRRRSTPLPPLPADGTCVPGNSYQKDCNTCRCLEGQKLACTEKACISKRSAEPQECSAGQTKHEGCNNCHCTNGLWSCTKLACPSKRSAEPQECSAGQTKKEGCNNCHCTNGLWSCTKLSCPSKRSADTTDEKCEIGDSKQIDCNNCKCTQGVDGKTGWACTRRICLPTPPPRARRDLLF